jgi:hypothetical protein
VHVLDNQIGFSFSDADLNTNGMYLEGLTWGRIENNRINKFDRGIVQMYSDAWDAATLIGVDDSDGLDLPPTNKINSCEYGIISNYGNQNLAIRCNDFNHQLQDDYVSSIINLGQLGDQGEPAEFPSDNDKSAANQFLEFEFSTVNTDDSYFSNPGYTYYYHQFGNAYLPSFEGEIVAQSNPTTFELLGPSNSCRNFIWPQITGDPEQDIEVSLDEYEAQITNEEELLELVEASLDGYNQNTQAMLDAIYGGITNSQELRDFLQENSPLSSEVLEAYMLRYDVPDEFLRDVLMMNSVVEGALRQLLLERIQDMPTAIGNEIGAVAGHNPYYETLAQVKNRILKLKQKQSFAIGDAIELYMTEGRYDDLVDFLERHPDCKSGKCLLQNLYVERSRYVDAENIIASFPDAQFSDWKDLATLNVTLHRENRDWGQLSTAEFEMLESKMLLDPGRAGFSMAKGILEMYQNQRFPYCIPIIPDNPGDNRSTIDHGIKIEENARLYPNPASTYVNVEVSLGNNQKGIVTIQDESGRLVYQREISEDNFSGLVQLPDLASGTYLVLILVDQQYVLRESLSIQH